MKAVQIQTYGGSDVLLLNDNAPKEAPKENQVLVQVKAASINPVDWKIRAGYMKDMAPLQFPATLGGDFAGVVSSIGEGVSEYKPGDEVFGSALVLNGGSGAFAQFAVANTKNVARKPSSISFEEAAALALVGASAVQALEEHIKLQKDQKILIHGGAGGIGHIAIQIAKAVGAFVVTTVNSEDVDFVKKLGADEVIDYKTQKFEELLKDFDAVFDTVGGETTDKSFQVLKKGLPAGRQGGVLVSMAGEPEKALAEKFGVTAVGQFTNINTAHLKRVAELAESGKIKVNIEKVFPLGEAKEAFKYQEKIHPKGKVVLKIE